MEDLKNDGENFRLEDLKDELLGSAVSDKFKEDDFDDVNRIRRNLHLTEDIESSSISNKAKDSKYAEVMNNIFSKMLKVF